MKLSTFIRKYRNEIDRAISLELNRYRFGRLPLLQTARNDKERAFWVLNHEPLYRFAKSEHVKSI